MASANSVHPRSLIAFDDELATETEPKSAWDDADDTPETPDNNPSSFQPGTGFTSPVMDRASKQRLTVVMLQEEIPVVRAGEAAEERLAKATKRMSDTTRLKLQAEVRAGQDAKERLFAAALPLIRTVATKEWTRRQQWGSQVPLDDLFQEATIGFLKGIASFRPEAIGKSATNYIGQWMLVETRRAAEVLDHDLQVGHDAGERFRRVRALRTRLATEYGREPTDEEIASASRNPNYVTRPGLVGKAPKEGEQAAVGKGLTLQQIREERAWRTRVGRVGRFATAEETNEDSHAHTSYGLVDPTRATSPRDDGTTNDPAQSVTDLGANDAIAALLTAAMNLLELPNEQREIIARRYGLPPHEETSAREIARQLGMQRDRVSRIVTAFQQEMVRPGGTFHLIVRNMNPDDLHDIGLGWTLNVLGEWPADQTHPTPPPHVLTEQIVIHGEPITIPVEPSTTPMTGILAVFLCDYHDRTFSGMYQNERAVPKTRPCPACGRSSERVRTKPTRR